MKKVTVLMSTYNGEKYLVEQIESLKKQEGVQISILARDDGSTDSTLQILKKYEDKKILSWYTGENLKPARSFLDLINKAPNSDYYAFCDQDDIWKPNKLFVAVSNLEALGNQSQPHLYCSNYQLVNASLEQLPDNGHSSTTMFNEALIVSNCTGCTTVYNKALLDILKNRIPTYIVMHDDWVHKVCLAVGGKVVYDKSKNILYRQHENNADGGIHNFRHRIKEVKRRIVTSECIRSKQLGEILRLYESYMSNSNKELIEAVSNPKKNLLDKVKIIFSKELKTKNPRFNRGFILAILFGYF